MARNLLLLFDRLTEPVYIPKGEEKISFEVPPFYLLDKYQPVAERILERFSFESSTLIPVKRIAIPDLSLPLSIGRHEPFSLFIPRHQTAATHLTNLFLGMRTVDDLIALAAYCRDRVNSQMFVYSLSVTILNRPDTKRLKLPNLHEIMPNVFFDSSILKYVKEDVNILPPGTRIPVEIPMDWTATDADPEHRVAYWREDIGINLHHWHWHIVYPYAGPDEIVNKDRRGELFYYMHHQLMARYNTERLCNNLPRPRPLQKLEEPIPQAYFPKLDQTVSGRAWPARPKNMVITNVNRAVDSLKFEVSDLDRFKSRIVEAIKTKKVVSARGGFLTLDDKTGIDTLGNMMESSILSPNRAYYGNFHNTGHDAISYVHDPDHRYLESFGVMADPATAMRDPVFYRWHQEIDNIFAMYKDSLTPYNNQQLDFPGIRISDIRITTLGANPNTLNSHWSKHDIDLSRGLDFSPRGSILARVQHLDHDKFSYTILVNNSNNREFVGTVRIFIAPKFDEKGQPLNVNDQRMLMIEMDKFTVRLSRGQNSITRESTQSALTIPFEATFRDLNKNRPDRTDQQAFDDFNICGCGWPQHMLVPKGNVRGYPMDLFVMISNYEKDKVNQAEPTGCNNAVIFCGLRNLKYPDAQAMGFPFDRSIRAKTMSQFLTPNMRLQQITVRFSNVIKQRQ